VEAFDVVGAAPVDLVTSLDKEYVLSQCLSAISITEVTGCDSPLQLPFLQHVIMLEDA